MADRVPVAVSAYRPLTAGEIALVFLPLFVVALGYGAVLPILPSVLERVHASEVAAGGAAMHAGLFSAIYIGAFVIAAPLWGKVTDAQGPRAVLVIGLLGYAAATVWFGFADTLAVAYTTRFVAGVFAAGLLPATSALIVARCRGEVRSRHLAWVNTASIAGFLVGPALTGWLHDFIAADRVTWSNPLHVTAIPIWTTGMIAVASAVGIALGVGRSRNPTDNTGAMDMPLTQPDQHAKQRILLFSALGAFGVGAFEVGLSLQSQQSWRWSASALAWLFAICSLVMLVIQLALFARLRRRVGLSGLVVSGFAAMAAGFTLLAGTSTYGVVALLVAVIALGSGVLLPTLSLAMADQAGGAAVGTAIGYQNAAANLGQAAGSAAVGFLFSVLPVASFAIVAALMLAATAAAWRIARVPGRLLGVAVRELQPGRSHQAGAHE